MDLFTLPFPVKVRQTTFPDDIFIPEGAEPFTFAAEISSNRLDSYYTHMHESTLRNFSQDAQQGVSFLDSHDSYKLGIGYSFNGQYEENAQVQRTFADFYTVPGIQFGGIHSFRSTDDFIKAVKARLSRDVSVGFYGGREICDICGLPVWGRTECPHFPGQMYEINEELIRATSTIHDAHLAEVSAVFDGATPGAMITKFERGLAEGWIEREQLPELEKRFRISLPDDHKRKAWAGVDYSVLQFPVQSGTTQQQRGTTLAGLLNGAIEGLVDDDISRADLVAEMAAEAGVSAGAVNQVLNGNTNCPSLQRLEGFAGALDIPLNQLIAAAEADGCQYDNNEESRGGIPMSDNDRQLARQAQRISDLLARCDCVPAGIEVTKGVELLIEEVERLTLLEEELAKAQKRIKALEPLAEDGQQYRNDLVEAALDEGVRAFGQDFNREKNQAMLENLPLDMIRQHQDTWKQIGDARFKKGRTIEDPDAPEQDEAEESHVPASAYRS